jgi:hypothetical protein
MKATPAEIQMAAKPGTRAARIFEAGVAARRDAANETLMGLARFEGVLIRRLPGDVYKAIDYDTFTYAINSTPLEALEDLEQKLGG